MTISNNDNCSYANLSVIPAKAGIHVPSSVDSCLRRNDRRGRGNTRRSNFLCPLPLILCLLIFLYPLFFAIYPVPAHAADSLNIWEGTTCNQPDAAPCGICDGARVAVKVLDVAWKLAAIIAGGMIVAAGVSLMFTGANPGMKNKAKTWAKDAVIGFVICLSAFAIVNTLMQFLFKAPQPRPWNEIQCTEPFSVSTKDKGQGTKKNIAIFIAEKDKK